MDYPKPTNTSDQEKVESEINELKLTLPKKKWLALPMYLYQGFWCLDYALEGAIAFQTHFQASDTDIIVASHPKTGTTWLKSLVFAIVNRKNNNTEPHPFHTKNPHELVGLLEIHIYKKLNGNQPNLAEIPSPRLFSTHIPYPSLPDSIKTSKTPIVYVCRNPYDTFVSLWHFFLKYKACEGIQPDNEMMEKYVGMFCAGVSPFGPFDDHVLEYWKESKQNPHKVLFLEYEGLKMEPKAHLKRLAEFVGCPFSEEEENGNVIDEIIELCSFNSLKEMEVNKSGKVVSRVDNKSLFRKGEVGDWTNYLTPSMVQKFDKMLQKFMKAGFDFTYYQMKSPV